MQEFKITKALPADKEAILDIKRKSHEYFAQTMPNLYRSSDVLFTEGFFNKYFNNDNHVALLSKVNNQTIGYALIDKVIVDLPMMKHRVYVYVQDIAVLNEYRNLGVATALLKVIGKIAAEWEAECLELAVHTDNVNAIRLYQGSGFSVRTYRMEKKLTKKESSDKPSQY